MSHGENMFIVSSVWQLDDVKRLDEARSGTFLSRSRFVYKIVMDYMNKKELAKEEEGLGVVGSNLQRRQPATNTADKNPRRLDVEEEEFNRQ